MEYILTFHEECKQISEVYLDTETGTQAKITTMALINYLTHYPWKEKTNFDAKILSGKKIHTIRRTNRGAKPGTVLSHGNSGHGYNRQEFLINHCTGTQEIELVFSNEKIIAAIVDGKKADWKLIAKNDGLTEKQFTDWFNAYQAGNVFNGFIIHWTDLKY